MISNRIKVLLAERNISAKALADGMADCCNAAMMSYIANGKVLPTREVLNRMCLILGCKSTDLYDAKDIDLLSDGAESAVPSVPAEQFLTPVEVETLNAAIKALDYRDLGEWVREMRRLTLLQYHGVVKKGAINLSEVILPESEGE